MDGLFEDLERLVSDAGFWAYVIVFAIALLDSFFPAVPSETLVILGGLLAADGTLNLPAVLLAGAAGAWVGDNVSFGIGRFGGSWLVERFGGDKTRRRLAWAEHHLRQRGALLLVTARFVPGGRTAVTLSSGITRQRWPRFVMATFAAGAIWATYASLLGYIGGSAVKDNHTVAFLIAFAAALSVTGIVELVRHLRNRGKSETEILTDPLSTLDPPV